VNFQLPTIKELGFEYMENVLKTYSEECKSDQIILDQNDRLNVQINHLEIGDGKLYVVSITPDSEVLKETYQSQQKILMNCFMIIIMIIILMYLYAKRISKVITFLSVRAEKISELEFEKEEKIPRSSIIELQHLVNTMETMNRSMDNFSRYVPKDLVSKLVKDQEQKGLHVQEADISLFFSDIEGFTTVSEEIEPSVLIKQLTEYFTIIMEVLNKNSGTVDKFIGDAVMAFWGAPEKCENHPFLACYSALKIQERLFQKNKEWEADRMRPFYTRIGLHTGQALVGNIGSETRYNYTAIGDNVNLAARLEGLNKYYGTYLMISGSIYESVRSDFIVRPLGKVSVKGKSRLVDIYELIGAQGHVDSSLLLSHKKLEDIKLYTLAYETIERKEFDAALTFLDHIVEKDKPVQMLINICREWKEKDLSTNPWQGVVRHMEGK
jgi:adenylate cyclase